MPIGASVRSHLSVVSSPESEVSVLNSRDEEPEEANNMQVPGVQFCNFLCLNSLLPEVFEPTLDIPRIQRIVNLHTRY